MSLCFVFNPLSGTLDLVDRSVTNANNVGDGDGVFKGLNDTILDFKSIVAGSDISLSSDADTLTMNFSGDKTSVGLDNVDNTSDLNKPISNDAQEAFDLAKVVRDGNSRILFVNGDVQDNDPVLSDNSLVDGNYFNIAPLGTDKRYMLLQGGSTLHFLDCRNPYAVNVIKNIPFNLGNFGQPQQITSVGEYFYVVTASGKIHTIDCTDLENPNLVAQVTISSGQHFDVASNGVDTIFIANTTNSLFIAVDVTNPLALTLINTSALTSLGAGVAYYDGYAYCADYGGNSVRTYELQTGLWVEVDNTPSVNTPSRLGVAINPSGEAILIANRYNSASFSWHSLSDPANIGVKNTINTPETVNVYSRAFSDNGLMYLATELGNILCYDIRDLNNVTLATNFSPLYPDETDRFSLCLGSSPFENFGSVSGKNTYMIQIGRNTIGPQTNPSALTNRNTTVLKLPLIKLADLASTFEKVKIGGSDDFTEHELDVDGSSFFNGNLGFYNTTPVAQPSSSGSATAGASYTTTEQTMLQELYDAVRALGLMG